MLVAACTTRKADHVEKRDPCGADNKRRKHMELDNNALLEKRTTGTPRSNARKYLEADAFARDVLLGSEAETGEMNFNPRPILFAPGSRQ